MEIDGGTKIYAVIGDPVEHSLSPAIHNAAFKQLHLNCVYIPLRVKPTMLREAVTCIRSFNIQGFNVTIPHKVTILRLLDKVKPPTYRIGAVNTVKNNHGSLVGYNTDGLGALAALKQSGIKLKGRKTVILGAGGAARALGFTLAEHVDKLIIFNRTKKRAFELATTLSKFCRIPVKGEKLTYSSLREELKGEVLLVNCTSVGMHPVVNVSPIDRDLINSEMTVFDAVYNPLKTRLLMDAQAEGAKIVNGLQMLVYQAAESFRIWTGICAPVEVMFKAARRHLER